MAGREDAGVVAKAQFRQNLKSPERALRNGERGRSISDDLHPSGILDRFLSLTGIGTEFLRAQSIDQPVPVAVTPNFVIQGSNVSDQFRKARRNPTQHKKSSLDVVLSQEFKHRMRISDNSTLQGIPILPAKVPGDCLRAEVLLHIHREPVPNGPARISNLRQPGVANQNLDLESKVPSNPRPRGATQKISGCRPPMLYRTQTCFFPVTK